MVSFCNKMKFSFSMFKIYFVSFKCKKCDFKLKDLSRIITESDGLLCERCLKLIREQQQQQQQLYMSNA